MNEGIASPLAHVTHLAQGMQALNLRKKAELQNGNVEATLTSHMVPTLS